MKNNIISQLSSSLKSGDKDRIHTLRLILAAIKDRDLDSRSKGNGDAIADSNILEILSKMVKQRKESISAYKKAGRNDLADQEDNEIKIILEFLPQKLTNGELKKIIEDTISATNSETIRDLGKVMAEIKNNYAGRCDLAEVSNILRKRLGG